VTYVLFAVIEELNGGGSAIGFVFALVGLAGLVGGTLVQRRECRSSASLCRSAP
jgi:hypothetical protein